MRTRKNEGTRKMKKGFTLVEMLVVIAILGILMAMMVPAAGIILKRAKVSQAKTDARVVVTVLMKYYAEYNRWPSIATNSEPQHLTDKAWVMVMSPAPPQAGDPPSVDNFKRIILFTPSAGALATTGLYPGAFVDPWGQPFEYSVDLNHDGMITRPDNAEEIRADVLVWSAGPDLKYEFVNEHDNLMSWE